MTDKWDFARFAPATGPEAARVARGEAVGGGSAPAGPEAPEAAPAAVQGGPVAISEPVPTGAVRASAAPAGPRYIGGRQRVGSVPILDVIEDSAGDLWEEIPLRRPPSREVGLYFEQLAALAKVDPEATLYLPVFAKPDGTPVPREVLDFLDDDDKQRVMEEAEAFLPLRLLRLLAAQQPVSAPTAGGNTGPTSSM